MTRRALQAVLALSSTLLSLYAAGCATPGPIVRLYPRDGNVFWSSGRAIMSHEQDGVKVAAAFEHQGDDTLAIRIEVQNDTPARLEVSPRDVTYTTCQTEALATCAPAQRVIDPEEVLDTLDVRRSAQVAQTKNDQTAGAALTMLSVVSDVAAIGSGHPENAQSTAAAVATTEATSAHDANTLGSIDYQWGKWSEAFRRTSLFPGQGIGGPVYIPIV